MLYQSRNFAESNIVKRYARKDMDGRYLIDDANAKNYTIRTRVVDRDELPEGIADQCDRLQGYAFNSVEI